MTKRTHFICTVENCDRPHDAKGLCHMHYNRWKRRGDPLAPLILAPDGSGWIGPKGHRNLTVNGKNVPEHRLIAEHALGKPLPPRAVVHHVDENPLNNAPSNLVICPTPGYHRQIHARMDALKIAGNANWRKCPYCSQYDDPSNMRGEKCGRFVHRECSATARRNATARRRASNDLHL